MSLSVWVVTNTSLSNHKEKTRQFRSQIGVNRISMLYADKTYRWNVTDTTMPRNKRNTILELHEVPQDTRVHVKQAW